eukprot:TRINITY_DN4762_c0_g1_i1.p1 TRINITY_DN4762_c0_g1~~TRINITY_DN4762_c0_g1_i1.p1  ORF type:complete len:1093 (-),score=369.83 TRINITY_DN4762_c0_g1_i1:62-3340(-)
MATNLAQFEQIVAAAMSNDNQQRLQAENAFNETKKTPDFCAISLLTLIGSSSHEQVKVLSAVLLRRNMKKTKDALWVLVTAPTQHQIKVSLLDMLEKEQNNNLRQKIADCISELGIAIYGDEKEPGTWDELLPSMFKLTKSQAEGHRESALTIFSKLAADIGPLLRSNFPILKGVLEAGLNDPSIKVRIAALNATAGFLNVLDDPQERAHFQQLTPLMLGTISASLMSGNEEEARSALQLFVDLAEIDPTFLRPQIMQIVDAMLTVANAEQLEPATRQLGVEFLVTLAESRPSMVRKIPHYLEKLVPVLFKMMLELDDDDEWNTGMGNEDDVDITDSDIAEESLDRLALALGGKNLVPIVFQIIPTFLDNPDWRHRHTALMCISIIGEGCAKQFETGLDQIVKNVVKFANDPHPRVRWAACNSLGQMSSDFGPEFQEKFHPQALPTLINVMADKANPRVQSHAAAAVINFCEHATPEILQPYLEQLLSKLLGLMQEGKTIVQEQVVTAIAAIADCMQESFVQFYDVVVPFLKSILSNANSNEYRMLRGKAMECISLIGVAVGKEKFYQDAKEIMEQFMKTQANHMEADDPQVGFLLQSWARICRCMGQDFVPYLGYVMPQLIASASISPDVTVWDADSPEDEQDGYEFIPIGDKRIGINTSALEEKSTACNMLYCYASELKDGFFPYVDQIAKLLVPLMKFYYHDGVRQAAITTMPHLLASAIVYLQKNAATGAQAVYAKNLWNFMFGHFVESMKEEPDAEILVDALEAFTSCIRLLGESAIEEDQLRTINALIMHLFKEVSERQAERQQRLKDQDHDDEEEEKIGDEEALDESIIAQIAEMLGALAKHTNKQLFATLFQEFVPVILNMLTPNNSSSTRQNALCVIDDVVEYLGPISLPFFPHFLPPTLQNITDSDPATRQAAMFGVGLFAQAGGEQIAPYVSDMHSRLTQMIVMPGSRTPEFAGPTENAISSVAKILKHHPTRVDVAKAFPAWLSWLPVNTDKIESAVTYSHLCEFLEQNNPHLIGEQYQNLPKLMGLLSDIYQTDLINDQTGQRIVNIVKQMRTSVPPEVLQSVWGTLSEPQRQKLQTLL